MIKIQAIPRPSPYAIALLLLLASVALNLWQAKAKWVADATAPLKERIDTLEATAATEDKISELRAQHDAELAEARAAIPVKVGSAQVVFRDRIVQIPAPTCPPTQARVDEWNAAGQRELK